MCTVCGASTRLICKAFLGEVHVGSFMMNPGCFQGSQTAGKGDGVTHIRSPPYHPQSNRQIECFLILLKVHYWKEDIGG